MSDLTDKEIESALAQKVMGYERPWTWHPLTRIEHAMQLIPKMREKGWGWDGSIRGDSGEYDMAFYSIEHELETSSVHRSPARAISMAAYEAICR